MSAQWIELFVGKKHMNNITNKKLAEELNLNPKYVGMVLNGKKAPKNAEKNFNEALDELIAEKSRKE